MIPYKDLMIGNYVKIYNGEIYQVEYINYDCVSLVNSNNYIEQVMCDRIHPIEVTEELLLKIGFESSDYPNEEGYATYNKDTEDYCVSICKFKNKWFCEIDANKCENVGNFYFKYLHELQNGIRLITKSDLEIKEL